MKEESKYYTPTLEEFHVGFELEIKLHELKPWEKHIWLPGDQASSVEKYLDQVRVKYLDKEDIESLGFKYNGNYADLPELGFLKDLDYDTQYPLFYNTVTSILRIERIINCSTGVDDYLFIGKIKNKSELQQILKMVL